MQHLSSRPMSISGISHLLLTRFSWNTGRFLGTSRKDSNGPGNICPGNICSGDICTYQEYLICYWPNFDETLKVGSCEHIEQIPTVRVMYISGISQLLLPRFGLNFKGKVRVHKTCKPSSDPNLLCPNLPHFSGTQRQFMVQYRNVQWAHPNNF